MNYNKKLTGRTKKSTKWVSISIGHLIIFVMAFSVIIFSCRRKQHMNQSEENEGFVQRQLIEVKAVVDNSNPTIGDIITYTLTVNAIPEISPKIPEIGDQIKGLRIVDIGAEGPKMIDGRNVWNRWYKLQPDFIGSYIIPPVRITYKGQEGEEKDSITSKIFIEVKTVIKEGQEPGDIRDIKPIEVQKERALYLYISIGALLFLFIIAGTGIWLWLRKNKSGDILYNQPPDELAIGELEKLKASKFLEEKEYKEFYFKLSEIFRVYIEKRFGFPAQENTTEEIIQKIEKLHITREQKDTVRLLTKWEDLVKFAKQIPTRERAEDDWDKTLNLIKQTRQMPSQESGGGVA